MGPILSPQERAVSTNSRRLRNFFGRETTH
jgi:hypothetical protein